MTFPPGWQWNELQQLGTDYEDLSEVERYDRRMGEFRDLPAEDAAILAELQLAPGAAVLELGTGTGHVARAAARAGHRVTAVDISPVMLRYAAALAASEGLAVDWVNGGFLTFDPADAAFDAAVSVAALHHLPDLWKSVALANVRRALRPRARFVLRDVVFCPATTAELPDSLAGMVEDCPAAMREEAVRHVAQEHSTLGWIMAGLLERAGFDVLHTAQHRAALVHYHCVAR